MPFVILIDDVYARIQILALASARPLGFALLFAPFTWARANTGVLRSGLAMALALPVAAPYWDDAPATLEQLTTPTLLVAAKEVAVGMGIALLLSIPFHAMTIAGGIVDSYRGSSTPVPSPAGDLTPFGQVFGVIALWTFAIAGGLFIVVDVLYASYGVWPLTGTVQISRSAALLVMADSVVRLVGLGLLVAGPLLALLAAVDLVFAVAAKVGRHINVTFLAMGVKALVAVLVLPAYALVLVRVAESETGRLLGVTSLLQALRP